MKSSLFLGIIVVILVPGQALKCYKSESQNETLDTSATISYCGPQEDACVLIIGKFHDGSVSAIRDCSRFQNYQLQQTKVVQPNIIKKKMTMYYIWCGTDLCNKERDSDTQTPPPNLHNHAGSISPNFIILFFTLCTLVVIIKNF